MLLFRAGDYADVKTAWLAVGDVVDCFTAVALEFHENALELGMLPDSFGMPDGSRRSAYVLEFFYPEQEGGADVVAHVFPEKVEFTFIRDGEAYHASEYPHELDILAFRLWSAMNLALFEGAEAEDVEDFG